MSNNVVNTIAIDAQGNKWFGTSGGGVAKFDNTNWTVYKISNSGLPSNYILSVATDNLGNKWFGADYGGVTKFDDINWTVYNTSNSGLPEDIVYSIVIDALGNKWFGTNNGVGVFNENGIITNVKDEISIVTGEFIVYPNPAKDMIAIEVSQAGTIAIFNSTGMLVKEFEISGTTTQTDISKLPSGLYILQVIMKDGIIAKKFIKE